MQKSLYQNRKFAEYWNDRAGETGEVYKRYILDPLMIDLVGNFANKTVLELGCGNGYLAPKLVALGSSKIVMMDISKLNLEYAAKKCKDKRVSFIEQDATERWNIKSNTIDIIYSNMMLNEVENIKTPIEEAFRVLTDGGIFVFSVTHPAWDLYIYAQEKVGVSSTKIKGLNGYFKRGYAKFLMGGDRKSNPSLANKYQAEFELDHYHRTISDYFKQLADAGFTITDLLEPELTKELLNDSPRFVDYLDNPIGLIFCCTKNI